MDGLCSSAQERTAQPSYAAKTASKHKTGVFPQVSSSGTGTSRALTLTRLQFLSDIASKWIAADEVGAASSKGYSLSPLREQEPGRPFPRDDGRVCAY